MKDLTNIHQQNDAWLKDLFDHAHDLIQIVQVDGTLLYVNKSWSTLLGYSKDELQGKHIDAFIEEADRLRYHEYRRQIISGHLADDPIVFRLQAKSGQTFPVEGVVSVKLEAGIPVYTRGIFRDITVRLQNESKLQHLNQELRDREQNLQQLLIHAPDAVIVINQQSCISFWNPKAETLFGWRADEVLHQDLASIIIPPRYREAHTIGMKRYLETGESRVLNRTIEITALNRNGEEFYVALTISHTMQGGETVFIAFIRDITEQKQNQWELERKTKQLEQSNARLEDFAHAASHDMKEPIRKVLTFTDRLKMSLETRMNETEKQLFNRVENAAQRMGLLVDDLLEFSHVSERPLEKEKVDLNQKLANVMRDLELLIEEKGAKISVGTLPIIKGYRRQLQQLFQNLIGNALKYSKPNQPPIITVTSEIVDGHQVSHKILPDQKDKIFYLIEVRDNGIGFEPQYGEQIFGMFQRLHGKAAYEGTGVGLSIARKVVENHSGYIWAESQPGHGATFKVVLPIDQLPQHLHENNA